MAEVNHFYAEGNAVKFSTSSTWVDVDSTDGRITGASLSANTKYLIIARALFTTDNASNKGSLRIQTTDDTNIESKSETIVELNQTSVITTMKSWLFVHSFTTDATPDDIDFQVRTDSGARIFLDQYTLLVIDLDDLGSSNYAEDINAATGVEYGLSYTSKAQIPFSSLDVGEDYVVLGCIKTGIGSTGRTFSISLRTLLSGSINTTVNVVTEEGEDTAEDRMTGIVGRYRRTGGASHLDILALEEAASGNMTFEGSYLIALKASAFADFEYDYQSGTQAITSEATVATVGPYTPTTNGNHLIIGRTGTVVGTADGAELQLHLEDGTTETRTGDTPPKHDQGWDVGKDAEDAITMQRISISAQKTYNLRATGGTWTAEDRWLLVLNLNLASSGLPITPAPVTVNVTPGSMVITTGSVPITPAAVTVNVTPGSVVVTQPVASQDVTPAAVTVTATPGSVVITTGSVAITPSAVTVNVTPGSVTLNVQQAVSLTGTSVTATPGSVILNVQQAITLTGASVGITPGTMLLTTDVFTTPAPLIVTATPGSMVITTVYDITPNAVTVNATPGSLVITTGSVPITPDAVTVTATPGSVVVTTGSVPITPEAVTVNVTPGSVTLNVQQAISLAGVAVAVTPGSMVITTGSAPVTPAAVTVNVTAGSMVISQGDVTQDITPDVVTVNVTAGSMVLTTVYDITPDAVTVTATPGSMVVTTGSVAITPDAVTVTATPGSMVVTTGAVAVTPEAVTVNVTAGTLGLAASIDLSAAAVTVTPGSVVLTTTVTVNLTGPTVNVVTGDMITVLGTLAPRAAWNITLATTGRLLKRGL